MPSPLRDIAVLGLFGTLLSLTECSQLTKVDWSLVKPEPSTGGGGASAGGPAAGADNAGAGEGGMAGEAGAAAGEGGQLEGGGDTGVGGTLGGGGGSAGHAGTAGVGGTLGGTGGGAGTAGSGGSGGSGPLHPTCSTAPTVGVASPDSIKDAIVFFDGGAGGNGNRGGRAGLDAACATAKGQLGLLQSMTHAVISVSTDDQIYNMPEVYGIPRKSPHVVSPHGIEIGPSWDQVWKGDFPSLVCTGVMPPTVTTWLTGSNKQTLASPDDPLVAFFGLYDFSQAQNGTLYNNGCNGWTLGDHDSGNLARVGSAIADHDPGTDGTWRFISYLSYYCDVADDHILCAAYDPAP